MWLLIKEAMDDLSVTVRVATQCCDVTRAAGYICLFLSNDCGEDE